MPTIDQIRAARALLNWSQADLAERAALSQTGIARIESGVNMPNSSTLDKITTAFDDAGIEFIADVGVQKRSNDVRILRGNAGFIAFRNDVLAHAQRGDLDICVSNVDERQFSKWGGEEVNRTYRESMAQIKTVRARILVQEGDTNFVASKFAEYRWVPKSDFGDIPFYIYADNTAIISFEENDINIFIIHNPQITNFYRKQFDRLWSLAQRPKEL